VTSVCLVRADYRLPVTGSRVRRALAWDEALTSRTRGLIVQ
jgi:hypothetical protein